MEKIKIEELETTEITNDRMLPITDEVTEENSIKKKSDKEAKESKRIKSIDRFRGFCVFCMLIFQFLKNFPSLGILSRLADHSLENGIVILPGMTLADIIAPAFIFAIGLTFTLSFNKWQKLYGTKMAIVHYLERALAIIGLGTFLDLCNKVLDSFSGYTLNAFDWTVFAFAIVALIGLVLRLLALIPAWKKKLSFPAEQIFYIALSCMGIMNIIITTIDFINIYGNYGAFRYNYWVTLQGIGFAILVAFPFVKSKPWVKFVGALAITIAYTVFHNYGDNRAWLDVIVHGGVVGGFGWGAMLIFDMFIADLYFSRKHLAFVFSAFFCAIGVFLTQWLGTINLGSCSPTFILVSVGLSGIIFFVFDLLDKYHKSKFDPLVWWGKNPIIMFLVEFFVIGVYTTVMPASALAGASWWLALIQGIVAIVGLTAIAYGLSKSKKSLSL